MSAPESVRTKDGITWTLRTVTSSGIALYAPKGVCECPDFVMATLAELAEHGIQSAELAAAVAEHGAFPMPVGTGPQPLSVERLAEIAARVQAASAGPWWTDTLAESDGSESIGVGFGDDSWIVPCQDLDPADAEFIAHARADVPALLTENAGLRSQVAALLDERHSTNEALSKADEALRADREGPALPWAASMDAGDLSMFLGDLVSAAMGRWRSEPEVPDRVTLADIEKVCADWRTPGRGLRGDAPEESAPDAVAQSFAPVPVLREVLDGEHYAYVHHEHRTPHDLPEMGGA